MLVQQAPVEPSGVVVLPLGLVVAALGPPHFVTHQQHWHSEGKDSDCEKVFSLAISQLFDGWIVGRTLDAAVPTSVIVGSVAVVFAVRLIVLLVIGNKII